nr:DNA topoisomerase I [Candidatus Sigynarchaeota archaeon]
QYLKTISAIVNQHAFDRYVVATDYDTEGSVIGYNILRFACTHTPSQLQAVVGKARRMKFSALTQGELRQSWSKMEPALDCARIEAGYTRHLVDILFGLNLSSALTSAVKHAGKGFQVFSIGRVQGPTLKEVCDRDKSIETHVPESYWEVRARTMIDGKACLLESIPLVFKQELDANAIKKDCENARAIVSSIQVKNVAKKPPVPFNLAGLQREASHLFKFKPSKTLKLAEKLYLDALISYPRTDNEIIPPTIDARALLNQLGNQATYKAIVDEILRAGKLIPSKGTKTDDAHPPILPTGLSAPSSLAKDEERLLDLVTRRFLSLLGTDLTWNEKNNEIISNGHPFRLVTRHLVSPGWTAFYPFYPTSDLHDTVSLKAGQELSIDTIDVARKQTQPPPHHSEITLMGYMERVKIGTKSTRAEIIEKLKERSYIDSDPIRATDLGKKIVELFEKFLQSIVTVDLTRDLEDDMDAILEGKQKKQAVIAKTTAVLKTIISQFKARELDIGNELGALVGQQSPTQRTLGTCPVCKQRSLVLVKFRGRKRFIACEGYLQKSCTASFPVSQAGQIYPTGKTCPHCAHPLVKCYGKGKKPWIFCVNWVKCPGSKKPGAGTGNP